MGKKEYDFDTEKDRLIRALGELQDRISNIDDEISDDAEAEKLRDHIYEYMATLTKDTYAVGCDGGYDPNELNLNNDGGLVSILDMRDRLMSCFDSLADRILNLRDVVTQTCNMIDEIANEDLDTDDDEPRIYKEYLVGYDGDALMVIKNNCVVNILRGDVAERVCGLLEAELHFEDEKDGFGLVQ